MLFVDIHCYSVFKASLIEMTDSVFVARNSDG